MLTKYEAEGKLDSETILGRGVFDLASGDKLVQTLRCISDHAVLQLLKREYP